MLVDFVTILFWLSVASIFHTYVIYPLFIQWSGSGRKQNNMVFHEDDLPFVSIIIAAHNEEKVMEQKMKSTLHTHYPEGNFEVLIGADSCTDNTLSILNKYNSNPHVNSYEFNERKGKGYVVNSLVAKSKGEILILTDANVFFEANTIYELVKHYKNDQIGQVGGNILNTNIKKGGISIPEKNYLDLEKKIKYNEGKLWGCMIGAFGGCYSIRKNLYRNVPTGYLMDDFYISMGVLEDGFQAIFEPKAVCYEDVSDKLSEEFRRKLRISAGNWQNLFAYKNLLFTGRKGVGFAFLSHKILRWKTPFFMLFAMLASFYLGLEDKLYTQLFYFQVMLFVPLCLDLVFRGLGVHVRLLRHVTHFYSMNFALLLGFFKFLFGVKTNVWKPTERNQ